MMPDLDAIYPRCREILPRRIWIKRFDTAQLRIDPEQLPVMLAETASKDVPGYLADLASLELDLYKTRMADVPAPADIERVAVNPALHLRQCCWKNLSPLLMEREHADAASQDPETGTELVMIWKHPQNAEVSIEVPSQSDLLALKLIVEETDLSRVSQEEGVAPAVLNKAIDRAVERGLLLAPGSLIRRDPELFPATTAVPDSYLCVNVFTLQWHVTQACDLACRHCYDRSRRATLTPVQELGVLDQLGRFCDQRNARGHVSFTGGNPLLHPHLTELYRAASQRGFTISILGNPSGRRQIEDLTAIQMPEFFQVSLEGLQAHNDAIRGDGHFKRTIHFLEILRELEVPSKVMLTLTRDNVDQLLPLCETLEGYTDDFTFNRLSRVGSGADMALPSPEAFAAFLDAYLAAAGKKPMLRLKDNLLNIPLYSSGKPLFGGCTGYGCGAAFSFLTLLSDGEVHACRKFPSPLGNLMEMTMDDLFDSDAATRYRNGALECRGCPIRPVCGGCLATTYSCGLDPLVHRDPCCFMKKDVNKEAWE
jgi:selenobiotic family peptide radical SAM maturase